MVTAELRTRAFIILGLSGLAVAQPLLDLFGQNPEFFVAGNYSRGQIVWFALLIAVVPPLVGIGATALAMVINDTFGTIVFVTVVAALATAFGLALLRTLGLDQIVVVAVLALLVGAGVAVLVLRTRGTRLFVSYLAVANLFFLGSFFFLSPTSELVAGGSSGDLGDVSVPTLRAPVVVIVLDEFPAATIMRTDGSLNDERYPGFAELASVSTWFRNASSQYNLTHRAVPSILDGTLGDDDDLPTWGDHPRNLFTLLGADVPVHRYESVTDLCPPTVCEPPPRQPLSQAIEDASVVYGHRVLPGALRDDLPAIDNSWGAYGAEDDATTDDDLVRQEAGAAADASGDQSLIEKAYAQMAGARRRRAQPARPGGCAPRHDGCDRRLAGRVLRPRRAAASPVGAVAHGRRDVVLARAHHRSERHLATTSRRAWSTSSTACRSAPPTRSSASSSTICAPLPRGRTRCSS